VLDLPISKRWSPFTEENIRLENEKPGIYELGDVNGFIVYIGQSSNIRKRLLSHLFNRTAWNHSIKYYRIDWIPTIEFENKIENALKDYFFKCKFYFG